MNFQQLEYVLAVHKHKHFAIAADSCDITQATLSAMIKKLEEELGILIFDRSRKPVMTTDAGIQLIEKAERILAEREEIKALKSDNSKLQGELQIGIIPTVASTLLPLILPQVINDNPELKLDIQEVTTEQIKHLLKMDQIDIGILATPVEDPQFEEHILYYESMMVYGVENINKNYVSSEDVRNKQVWLLEEGHCFREQAITICEIKQKDKHSSMLNFKGSSFESLIKMSTEFGGLTLIPELYFNELNEDKKARTKPFRKPIPVREISIINYRKGSKTKTINYLIPLIQDVVKDKLRSSKYQNKDLEIIGI